MAWVDTKGLRRGVVLAALVNEYVHPDPMMAAITRGGPGITEEEAEKAIASSRDGWIDYLALRAIKASFDNPDGFEARLYDRDTHEGAAQEIVDRLRSKR